MAKDKRVEVLFDPADYKRLEEVARREGKPFGARSAMRWQSTWWALGGGTGSGAQDFSSIDTGIDAGSPEDIKEMILKGYDEDDARLYEAD
ncbi:MAG: hypothetical protein M3O21_02535 [Chloroflexota bacterium]|nr:hypothetical protein [Chloroflexota bacterium]